ncbi:MAG: 4a-hydroxytetrahydrobiopterin dehydratase [Phycisphaerae bacterium]|jgi:4a-hydroxytetrahydrobiopterin dehydratase
MNPKESHENNLADKKCIPCAGGIEPLKGDAISNLLDQLGNGWQVIDEHHLEKQYKFKDFAGALQFVNKVGELAEQQGHHPDVYLAWGKVKLTLWTHKIKGLHESDFIFAAKADKLYPLPVK